MAAPRKTTQPVNTNSGDTTPQTEDVQARIAAEEQPERTPAPEQPIDQVDHAVAALTDARAARTAPTTEDVVLIKEAGGHRAGATITVTHGAAEYLREQGYVEGDETDED